MSDCSVNMPFFIEMTNLKFKKQTKMDLKCLIVHISYI